MITYVKASGSCADPFFFLVQVIQGTLWPSRTSNSQSRWSWEGPGVGLGPLGGALGVPGGPRGGAWGSYLLPRKCPPERLGRHLLSSASLEGPWGLPGGSLGVLGGSLGAPRRPSGHPGAPLTIRGPTLEGLWGGLGGPKNRPRPFFEIPGGQMCVFLRF